MIWEIDMLRGLTGLFKDERGVSAVEYGLIIALIVLAIMVGLTQLAEVTTALWDTVADKVIVSSSGS